MSVVEGGHDGGLDVDRLRREIDEEVRARRAAGDFPPSLERELDALFARYAPAAASDDLDTVLADVEERATVAGAIPTASRKPGGRLVKQTIARGIGWYHTFLAQQLSAFASTTAHALRLVARRLEALEAAAGTSLRALEESERAAIPALDADDVARVAPAVLDALRSAPARVVVAECGEGHLLEALVGAGVDAYGVEPRTAAVDAASDRDLEVRQEPASRHLRAVEEGALSAVVLAGVVERSPVGELVDLLDRAATRLAPGGRLVVLSRAPAEHAARSPVESDLAPGRPLHAETWAHLMRTRGLADVEVALAPGSGPYVVLGTRPAVP